jgi:EpsI family protein
MIARRDLIIGGACAVAAAAGLELRPHREVRLVKPGLKIADLVPATFGEWTSEDMGDPLAINGKGTLSAHIYNELVVRAYKNAATGTRITALMAYGGKQSDDLQLHRPEVCYPAFGYALTRNEPLGVPVAPGVTVPSRRLAAEAEGRSESVIYWSRIGEFLPQDGGQQRSARFKIALAGIVPDGLLSRFSIAGEYPDHDWKVIEAFVAELVSAVKPTQRKVLIGSERAAQMQAVPASSRA